MKRIITFVLLAVLCFLPLHSHAQSAEAMIKRFKKCDQVEHQHISGMMLGLLRMVMPNDDAILGQMTEEELQAVLSESKMTKEEFVEMFRLMTEFINRTKNMTLLSLEQCSEADKQAFIDATAQWTPEGFTADEEQEGLFLKYKENVIQEIVALNRTMEDCSLMTMKGDLTPEFITHAEQSMTQLFKKMEQTQNDRP